MSTRRTSAIIALIAGPAIGGAYPFIQLAIDCRMPASEACVWGKALMPVSLAISVPLLGSIAAIVVYAALEWRRRTRGEK